MPRVAEILDTTNIEQWYHVKSKDNISDIGTRSNASVVDICEHSEWQNGSTWMSLPIEQWPISQDTGPENVPGDELLQSKFSGHAKAMESPISFDKYKSKSYEFVINLIARVLKIAKNKSFKYIDIGT